MESLNLPNLTIHDSAVCNEGQYLCAELAYPASFTGDDTLRPHLLLEFIFADVRLPTKKLSVNTIIEDVIKVDTLFSPSLIDCISSDETAIEKCVGLTRRIAAIERQRHHDDITLVRHIYDLTAFKQANLLGDAFFKLAKTIVLSDAKQFKNQHPEYAANPSSEIKLSLSLLKSKPLWEKRYEEFIEVMVYDNTHTLSYEGLFMH